MNLDKSASSTIDFKNNISLFVDTATVNKYHANFRGNQVGNITKSNNLWCKDPSACGSTDDVDDQAEGLGDVYADPKLVGPFGYSYVYPTSIYQFTGQEFALESDSNAKNAGTDLDNTDDNCVDDITVACAFHGGDSGQSSGTDFSAVPIEVTIEDQDDHSDWEIGAWLWEVLGPGSPSGGLLKPDSGGSGKITESPSGTGKITLTSPP